MNTNFEKEAIDFLENYHLFFNESRTLLKKSNKIAQLYAKRKNIISYKVKFVENTNIGIVASVNPKNSEISVNQTRNKILTKYKINTSTKTGLKKFLNLKQKLEHQNNLRDDEKYLLNFLNNKNWQPYFHLFGNYKLLNFQILHCILHENQHLVQLKYKAEVLEKNDFETAQKFPYEAFVATFQTLFNQLYMDKKLGKYERENKFFPIELDAEYSALTTLYNLLQTGILYNDFNKWKKCNNSIQDIKSSQIFTKKIWQDFLYLYKRYNITYKNKLKIFYDLIIKNKKNILQQYSEIYNFYAK